jgi:hypothetical protein
MVMPPFRLEIVEKRQEFRKEAASSLVNDGLEAKEADYLATVLADLWASLTQLLQALEGIRQGEDLVQSSVNALIQLESLDVWLPHYFERVETVWRRLTGEPSTSHEDAVDLYKERIRPWFDGDEKAGQAAESLLALMAKAREVTVLFSRRRVGDFVSKGDEGRESALGVLHELEKLTQKASQELKADSGQSGAQS